MMRHGHCALRSRRMDSALNNDYRPLCFLKTVIARNQSTCIGFLLLRLTIDSQGDLIPVLNTGLKSNPKVRNYHNSTLVQIEGNLCNYCFLV